MNLNSPTFLELTGARATERYVVKGQLCTILFEGGGRMNKPWYRRKRLYVIISVLLLFVLWFQWESYTTTSKISVSNSVKNAVDTAFQSSIVRADSKSYLQMRSNGGPWYLIPQFDPQSQQEFQNGYNLQSAFAYNLSLDQRLPLYQIESFNISQLYDRVNISIIVKYELFAGLPDTTLIYVSENAPKKQLK